MEYSKLDKKRNIHIAKTGTPVVLTKVQTRRCDTAAPALRIPAWAVEVFSIGEEGFKISVEILWGRTEYM
jgi:hypothetical protein